jgi:putative DNA primase/helicase
MATTQQAKPNSQQATNRPNTPRINSRVYMLELMSLGYQFRINECDDSLEVNGIPITDPLRSRIRRDMRDKGYSRHLQAMEDAYLAHAMENGYHPIKAYLDGLKWDGYGHIDDLATYFTDIHAKQPTPCGDEPVFKIFFKRWIVGAVAKVLAAKQNAMLVLDGAQGIGKSHFVRWLASGVPSRYFIEKAINPEDKDDDVRLINKWIWEVPELGATTKRADHEAIKHFISKMEVTVRKPYGHYDVHKAAMASMIGTINNEVGFLNDATGNRRFLVCTLEDINKEYSLKIDVNQVWAEAVALYKSGGETEFLTQDETELQTCLNDTYMVDDPMLTGLVEKLQANSNDLDPDHWASSVTILSALGYTQPRKADTMILAAAAKKLSLTKYKKNGVWGYYGVIIPHNSKYAP